jgi:hypothetical protein
MSADRRNNAESRMRAAKDQFTAAARAALAHDTDAAAMASSALAEIESARAELRALDDDAPA